MHESYFRGFQKLFECQGLSEDSVFLIFFPLTSLKQFFYSGNI